MSLKMFGRKHLWRVALLLSVSYFLPTTEGQVTDPSEVRALQTIRRGLIDPLNIFGMWKRGDPCTSNWTGVLCFNETSEDGYLHVRELQLLNSNLSGSLAPELGQLSHMEILDFMWNNISGGIPKEIGNLTSLKLLLLNGNKLSGPLPEEIGNLINLDRIQIDENQISGPLPKSLANLKKAKHFHMNNNNISGQIPPELSQLPNLVHFLLDNNNLTGHLPTEFSELPKLLILQLDNNNFSGSSIPTSYGSIPTLLKLSLRNCSLQGPAPDLSRMLELGYLDLSWNQLTGPIPTNGLSRNLTTIDMSNNQLNGPIPSAFSGLPILQQLSLENNQLNGSVPSTIWQNLTLGANRSLILDFQNNNLTDISSVLRPPENVTVKLKGNPVCANQLNLAQFCGPESRVHFPGILINSAGNSCPPPQSCPSDAGFEYISLSPLECRCVIPISVDYRLKSPGFSDFIPYIYKFMVYLTSGLKLEFNQLNISSVVWEEGPRLRMLLKILPLPNSTFNESEILRIRSMFTGWNIPDDDSFGPYELIKFTSFSLKIYEIPGSKSSGLKKGQLAGIILGTIAGSVIISSIISIIILKKKARHQEFTSRKRTFSKIQIKIDGVKEFTFEELSKATNNFGESTLIGQGGYGKVYKGTLADGTVVAIKRAQNDSLQGSREFVTEIQLLSRLHHRNLVSLIGYCDEDSEQMLVYEFMPNGTLRDHLSANSQDILSFSMRLRIALGSARGVLYLHSEADPPIFHRDIKASNILLDSRYIAKVADFGLSRLAPVPEVDGTEPGHVSTVVKGTPGYLDPEYFLTHKLTDKSDVYSLGVVLLELLTGLQPISRGKNIVREVSEAYRSGMMLSIIDSRMGSYPSECVERFLPLALRCCQDETDARPSMSEVVRELENILQMTPEGDAMASLSMASDSSKVVNTPSMSMPSKDPFVSSDLLGSNLISGTIPTITPR